ncbi:MAG: hypothetical protein AAGI92_09050 [Pseudomonadota bacterium]
MQAVVERNTCHPLFQIRLHGPFRVTDDAGLDRTPRTAHGRAMLAMLAVAPNNERANKWLEDRLWSDRMEESASGSRRTCIHTLRKHFGKHLPVIQTDMSIVSLNMEYFSIEARTADNHSQFLEGINISDSEFNNWLRDERHRRDFEKDCGYEEGEALGSQDVSTPSPDESAFGSTVYSPRVHPNTVGAHRAPPDGIISSSSSSSEAAVSPSLVVLHDENATPSREGLLAQGLSSSIGQILKDHSLARVIVSNERHMYEPDAQMSAPAGSLILSMSAVDKSNLMRLALKDLETRNQVWSEVLEVKKDTSPSQLPDALLRGINVASRAAADWFASASNGQNRAIMEYQNGVRLVSNHTPDAYVEADACFQRAYEFVPNGVYLAWRAYIRSFMVAEMMPYQAQQLKDEVEEFVAKAIELAPLNSLVLSLCAHVKFTVFLSSISAFELAKRSIELSPANAFGWACLGVSESHLGRPENGIRHCRRARNIAGGSHFRSHIEILCCIVAVMAGKFEEARHFGELGHDAAPSLAAPLRFLTAIYFHNQDEQRAQEMLEKLQELEPGFRLRDLKAKDYPSESLRKSALIKSLPDH